MKNVEQHSHFRGRFATFRVFFCQKMSILDAFVVSSFAKHICLTPRKAVFCIPKDGLSHGESLSFGSETYIFRKFKIAHLAYESQPSCYILVLNIGVVAGSENCTHLR